jgi:NAD(P)-dependent dehydrogenase (short-subunit alcohol dehydrogenase family)
MESGAYVVVGGSAGIGREIASGLSRAGHEVLVASRRAEDLAGLDRVRHLALDVTAPPARIEALPDALQGLVYCPGTIRLKPFQRLTREDLLEDLQVNFLGAVALIQACLPHLKQSPSGASIVLFSTVAVATGMPFHASVAGAKGAVEGLTRSLAAELAPRIRVNAIAPSLTDTRLAGALLATDEKRQAAADRHPLKRIGTAGEIAALALFLLAPDSGWITGQVLHADGGLGALRLFR